MTTTKWVVLLGLLLITVTGGCSRPHKKEQVGHLTVEAAPVQVTPVQAPPVLPTCAVSVADGVFHFRASNDTGKRTPRQYIRLAFYDEDHYRHGFSDFAIEPMDSGELVRFDGLVPRPGAVSARVYEITADAGWALKTWR